MDKVTSFTKDEALAAGWEIEAEGSNGADSVLWSALEGSPTDNPAFVDELSNYVENSTLIDTLSNYVENDTLAADLVTIVNRFEMVEASVAETDGKYSTLAADLAETDERYSTLAANLDIALGRIDSVSVDLAATSNRVDLLTARLEELEANALKIETNNTIILPDGCKVLATAETGAGTGIYSTHEILGLNKYDEGLPTQFYDAELGNPAFNTTLNTKDNLAVDTAHGREYVQYISNGGSNVLYGDLSVTGSQIQLGLQGLTVRIQRINTTEVGAIIFADVDTVVPITRLLFGGSSEQDIRTTVTATPTGVAFDTVIVGTYVLGMYWITANNVKYILTIGSDNDDLSQAWLVIADAHPNTLPG